MKKILVALAIMLLSAGASHAAEQIRINSQTLPDKNVGDSVTVQFTANVSNAYLKWSISGNVPLGLAFVDGTLSGTLRQVGSYSFTVKAEGRYSSGGTTYSPDSKNFSMTVREKDGSTGNGGGNNNQSDNTLAPSIEGYEPGFNVGVNHFKEMAVIHGGRVEPYFSANNGTPPYKWTIVKGDLPKGLGLYACDSDGALGASNHTTDRYLYIGNLEEVPVEAGEYSFTLRLTDAQGRTAEKVCSGKVNGTSFENLGFTRLSDELITPSYGGFYAPYEKFFLASVANHVRSPYTWSVVKGVMPAGFDIAATDTDDGHDIYLGTSGKNQGVRLYLHGTREGGEGIYTFMVKVTDADGRSERFQQRVDIHDYRESDISPNGEVTLTDDPDPVISGTFANGKDGEAYSGHVSASGGTEPYTWRITYRNLPDGLSLNCSDSETASGSGTTGRYAHITGTPKYSSWGGGYYTFTLGVTDAKGNTNAKTFTVRIAEAENAGINNNNTNNNGTNNNNSNSNNNTTTNNNRKVSSGGGSGGCGAFSGYLWLAGVTVLIFRRLK